MFVDSCGLSVIRASNLKGDASICDGLCFLQPCFTSDVGMVSCSRGCPLELQLMYMLFGVLLLRVSSVRSMAWFLVVLGS